MKHRIVRISITLLIVFVSLLALLFFWPLPPLFSGVDYSRAVFDQNQHLLRLTLSKDGQYRLFTPLEAIDSKLIAATLLQEDRYFYHHVGINPYSLGRALWMTYGSHVRRVGASTITMQVARIRYHLNSKTLGGKLLQMRYALQLEMHYSKKELLTAYLNLAPYGSNVEGVGAASWVYYHQPAKSLDLPAALTLAVIPQHPSKRGADSQPLKIARDKLFSRWILQHREDRSLQGLMALPLALQNVRDLPFFAPHFVGQVLSNRALPFREIISSLDLGTQQLIERITKQYVKRKNTLAVNNAAVLVVDTQTMQVKALVGSVNFFDEKIAGQINATAIKRSPGSTLKPFIYALALDQGLIHPKTLLKDVPHHFGSYDPENFDNDFVGPVNATDALILSRNIPAITLTEQLHHPSLYQLLQSVGITQLKEESYYGLALTLGGAELTMQELAAMYAALANGGEWQPLRFDHTAYAERNRKSVFSSEASFLVLDMLKKSPPPDEVASMSNVAELPWKTGTSSGYRDAWTVGIAGPYVIAVWMGNANNTSNPAFIGKELSAPLFFELATALKQQEPNWPVLQKKATDNLVQVKVCKVSGMLPTRHCLDTENVWFIPGKSPIASDTIHREVAINAQTGLRTCHINAATQFKVYEFWPSDIVDIYRRAGIVPRQPPPFEKGCDSLQFAQAGEGPHIASPRAQVRYVIDHRVSKTLIMPLTAVVDADVQTVHWFVDQSYVGVSHRNQPLLWKGTRGHYVVRAVDDAGRTDSRDLLIEFT